MGLGLAKQYLLTNKYLAEDDDIDTATLAKAIRTVKSAFAPRTVNEKEAEIRRALEAIAVVLEKTGPSLGRKWVADETIAHLEDANKLAAEQREATGNLHAAMAEELSEMEKRIQERMEKQKDELQTLIQDKFQHLAEHTSEPSPSNQNHSNTYAQVAATAQMVATQLTKPMHDTWIQKGKTTERQLIIRRPKNPQTDPLANLNEAELQEKARVAIDMMGPAAADRPEGLMFIGARKLAGGDTILQLESNTSARWLRKPDVLKAFNGYFGNTSTIAPRTFPLILEFIPIFANITEEAELREIETTNAIPTHSLRDGRWLKNPERRKPSQLYAYAQVGCTDPEIASTMIRDGITVKGRRIMVRKPALDIPRCTKCQHRTWHRAHECKSDHDACARCLEHHRTDQCQVQDAKDMKCAVCKGEGHGAASVDCPTYRERLERMKARNPEHRYLYYPTHEPWTWARVDDATPTIVAPPMPPRANDTENKQRWSDEIRPPNQQTSRVYPPPKNLFRPQMLTNPRTTWRPPQQQNSRQQQTIITAFSPSFRTARSMHRQNQNQDSETNRGEGPSGVTERQTWADQVQEEEDREQQHNE